MNCQLTDRVFPAVTSETRTLLSQIRSCETSGLQAAGCTHQHISLTLTINPTNFHRLNSATKAHQISDRKYIKMHQTEQKGSIALLTTALVTGIVISDSILCMPSCVQCFDAVGWAAGRASGL